MLTKLLRGQLREGFWSLRWVVILVATVLLLIIQWKSAFYDAWDLPDIGPTFLNYMMLFNYFGAGTYPYLFFLPFFAALIGGSVYSREKHSGRLYMAMGRVPRLQVARSSLLSGFLLGGMGGLAPLALNLVIAVIKEPHMEFVDGHLNNETYGYPLIISDSWVYGLYERNQVLLLILTLLYVFALSGLFACLAVCVSFWSRYRYIELIVPFLLSYLTWLFTNSSAVAGLSFVDFLSLRVADEPHAALGAAITLPVLALIVALGYCSEVRHETF